MRLSDIRATLREIRVSPVKTLGQNFLHDLNLARWIVDQAEVISDDYIVEIGPGLGALTELLLQNGARVLAIEKDTRLANFLSDHLRHPRLEVVNIDALKFDPRFLFSHRRVKLLGNLPYNVSSQLLSKFLECSSPIFLWLFMLQKEMALRLSASPSTQDYGSLTVRVQLHHHVKYLRTIPATVFFPQPDVDSALVKLSRRDRLELPQCDEELFIDLVRRGFSQRRKQLRKLLRAHVPDWEKVARRLNVGPKARAEELSLLQWIDLTNCIAPSSPPDTRPSSGERLPVVDKNDRVLRLAPRSEVHGNNLCHRAVHILISNSAGEVYLQQRSRGKDRHPLKWDSSAAGHVTGEETYDETARRELGEELGINVALERVLKLPASRETDQEFVCLYRGPVSGSLKPNRAEIESGGFFPQEVIDGWVVGCPEDFAPGFLECWRAYRRKLLSEGGAS